MHIGFYSENEFDLSSLMRLRGEALELGRSCIASTHRSFATEKYRVYPVESCRMTISEDAVDGAPSRAALRKLSPILKGYLRAGAMICGAPAYDAEFGTADVLVILEMEKMAGRYKQRYVGGAEALINR